MNKIAIIGANGQLGSDLLQILKKENVVPLTHGDIEVSEMNSVSVVLKKYQPDIIINTAAYHRVDDCETELVKAFQVNAIGARNVAVVAQEIGAKLVFISTDYVFGGGEPRDIPYTEFDTPIPVSVYGKAKLAGEDFIRHLCTRYFIVRGSGLFGVAGSSGKGGNFIETMLRLGKERDELKVVSNQIFSPTYTQDLASKIVQLSRTNYYGTFHITNSGTCSWYDFTKEILILAGLNTKVTSIISDQYPQKARRPAYSVLDHFHLRLLGMDDLPPWQVALKDYMKAKGHIK
jgi:dTDP-4-dehydrorhamnose reductase